MYSGCSPLTHVGSQSCGIFSASSCHHTSRLLFHATFEPLRRYTTTWVTDSHSPRVNASSTAGLSGISLPPLNCPSAVTTTLALPSLILSWTLFAENPPNTTE